MKIIFLDIDGVLNGYNPISLFGWKFACLTKNNKIKSWYRKISNPTGIHKNKVKKLSKIIKKTNAKVVMSSCWRGSFWKTPYEAKTENQKTLTDLLNKYNIEVIDITPYSNDGKRDKEILSWLSNNEEKVDGFIILDDESADLQCFKGSNLIQTITLSNKGKKKSTGLTNKHVKAAIKYLSTYKK